MKIPALALGAIILTAGAFAADEPPAPLPTPAPAQAPPAQTQQETRASVRMEAIEIKGEYENPDIFFIIPRKKASMDLGNLMIDYTKEIGEPFLPHRFAARYGAKGDAEGK